LRGLGSPRGRGNPIRYIYTSFVAIASFSITGISLANFWAPTSVELHGQAGGDFFGGSVAIDGDTCVIGAMLANSGAGSAYVFTPDASGDWSQVAELTTSDGASNDYFGYSVAIDGDTCVIGGSGSAYVFTSDASGNWSQVAALTASDGSGDQFGHSVAIDGETCVIGAWGTNSYAGNAYVFTPDASGVWSKVAELTASDGASGDQFGRSVAIDGGTCVIGAYRTNSFAGSAYVFTTDASGNWSQVAELNGQASKDRFGYSVAIDSDTCVIGACGTNSKAGNAYVFTPDASGVWSKVAELTASDGASGDQFGNSVAIDGGTCVIGAWGTNSYAGNAYVFTTDGSGNWSQVAELNGQASKGQFGYSVAIDSDTCVIGAYIAGSAYVYTSDATGNWSPVSKPTDAASSD
jgi:hypothetical protein